jgi:hypothetical protein
MLDMPGITVGVRSRPTIISISTLSLKMTVYLRRKRCPPQGLRAVLLRTVD